MTTVFELESPAAPKKPRVRRGGWSWGPTEGAKLRVMSNGGGIQSTTLILMMCVGELLWVDHIIHADVGDESDATYAQLDWLDRQVTRFSNGRVGIHRVSRGGSLSDRIRNRASGRGVINNDSVARRARLPGPAEIGLRVLPIQVERRMALAS